MSVRAYIAGCALALGALGACETTRTGTGSAVAATDSSGVTIYELANLPSLDHVDFEWSIELERSIWTGSLESTEGPLLYNPQNVLRLPDGTLVVLDAGEYRLAVIPPDRDTVIARFGRTGQGPGEVLSSNGLLSRGGANTFWLMDPGNQRRSQFSLTGELLDDEPVVLAGNGGLAIQRPTTEEVFFSRFFLSERAGSALLTDSVLVFDHAADRARVVAPMPARVASRSTNTSPFPYFAAQGAFAPVASGGVVVGRSDEAEFRHFSDRGELLGIVRIPMARRAIPLSEKAAMIERMAQEYAAAARATHADLADWLPLWSQLWPVGDSLFALEHTEWAVPRGDPVIRSGQRIWRVFSVAGRYVGVIRFPEGFGYPHRIEADRVIGIRRDELGVGTIESYSLTPPRGNRPIGPGESLIRSVPGASP